MAQLSDDCFAQNGRLMSVDEALDLLRHRLAPVTMAEEVSLADAGGRILATDVHSDRAVPPHDNAAVDGYAVFFDDLRPDGPTRLPIGRRVAAGHPIAEAPRRGQALRVFTGAAMPAGPDTIFMQEDCRVDGDFVDLPPGIKRGANLRHAGEDVTPGSVILTTGRRLRPQDVGLAASIGRNRLSVHRRLRAAIFSTGDEIADPGTVLPAGGVFDANRYALRPALMQLGCAVTDLGIVKDDRVRLETALRDAAAEADLIVTSGGVSLGDEDHVKAAFEAIGGHLDVWRLAIKPGRPLALGHLAVGGRSVTFVGLPGNPVAVLVTLLIVARPIILQLAGAVEPEPTRLPVRAGFQYRKKAGRREYLRVRLSDAEDGVPVARKFPREGAGILTSMVEADGLVELRDDSCEVREGEIVPYISFCRLS